MNRLNNRIIFLWLIMLSAVFLLAACSPNDPDLSQSTEGEAPVTASSSSPSDETEETEPLYPETFAETAEATERAAETTAMTTGGTKETSEETAVETTETTTETTSAKPTATPVPTAAPTAKPTPTPEPTPAAMVVSLAIKCHIATEAGLTGAPADGIILDAVTVDLSDGESVFDILIRVGRAEGIAVASRGSGANAFVTGIAGLTAVDAKSGWVFSVNGEFANIGSGAYQLSPGDVIEWHYTMDTGNDL